MLKNKINMSHLFIFLGVVLTSPKYYSTATVPVYTVNVVYVKEGGGEGLISLRLHPMWNQFGIVGHNFR